MSEQQRCPTCGKIIWDLRYPIDVQQMCYCNWPLRITTYATFSITAQYGPPRPREAVPLAFQAAFAEGELTP